MFIIENVTPAPLISLPRSRVVQLCRLEQYSLAQHKQGRTHIHSKHNTQLILYHAALFMFGTFVTHMSRKGMRRSALRMTRGARHLIFNFGAWCEHHTHSHTHTILSTWTQSRVAFDCRARSSVWYHPSLICAVRVACLFAICVCCLRIALCTVYASSTRRLFRCIYFEDWYFTHTLSPSKCVSWTTSHVYSEYHIYIYSDTKCDMIRLCWGAEQWTRDRGANER